MNEALPPTTSIKQQATTSSNNSHILEPLAPITPPALVSTSASGRAKNKAEQQCCRSKAMSDDDEDRRRRSRKNSKRHHDKKDDRKKKKRHRKEDRRKEDRPRDNRTQSSNEECLADAILHLVSTASSMIQDLPVLLIQLARGTTLDLTQMEDLRTASALQAVFEALGYCGLSKEVGGSWAWRGGGTGDELILVKVVRTMLNEFGLTMDRVEEFERKSREPSVDEAVAAVAVESSNAALDRQVRSLLAQFVGLNDELRGLCQTILDGESVALDGLEDVSLRQALEQLFAKAGLELHEMEDSDKEEDDEDDEPVLGYGLPDDYRSREALARVMNLCDELPKKPVKGPTMPSSDMLGDSDDDVGPAPLGVNPRTAAVSKEFVKTQAALRDKEIRRARGEVVADGEREEWMVDPGKYDFLGAVRSGQAVKSRGFSGKAGPDGPNTAMDPRVKAEMDAIMEAHQQSRGQSLVDQHREARAAKLEEKAGKQQWQWNRGKDLDAGRRVDKNALNTILEGADKLKEKFQGGFSGR